MRKFLSLVLALVMMMSLVTINAGAKEFTDADDITYVEAVDVISTINVMDGYEGGGFSPAGNLTRGAAAKIICNLILGPTTAAELHADTAPYRDVPVNHTFAGYIAYCQKEGIVSGYADGTFRPAGTLTGYAFMKMLLGALGYDAEIEGYVGPNWSINVAKKAIGIGLNKSLVDTFNGVDYITREEAALYAFNTLKADLVEYDQKITATVNGAEVTVGSSNAKPQEWDSQQTRRNNIYDDSIVQFAEQYFNKLVLTQAEDVFGRPDREWKFDGEDIGAYINYDLLKEEYTAKVTGKDLYELLGSSVVDTKDGYKFNITIDGETEKSVLDPDGAEFYGYFTQGNLVRTNTEKVGETGNGVLTQVFVDSDKEVVWIAIINTYLAKATGDYNEKKDEVTYETWNVGWANGRKSELVKKDTTVNLTVSGEDFEITEVKEDDIVLVHVAEGEIKEFVDPEVIDSTEISSFKKGDWVNAEGTQYDYATTAKYDDEVLDEYDDSNMKDTTYRVFLDEYGYLIGIEIIEEPNQYLFLAGIDTTAYNLGNKRAEANVIFLDGTSDTVTVNLAKSEAYKDSIKWKYNQVLTFTPDAGGDTGKPFTDFAQASLWNTWCTYSVDESGVYTLTEVASTEDSFKTNDSGKTWSTVSNKRDTDKVGQGHNNNVSSDTKIDTKRIGLNGIATPGYDTVYGNDDSIYLVASLKKINDAKGHLPVATGSADLTGGPEAVIIDGVDSVITGVRNASLDVYTLSQIRTEVDEGDYKIDDAGGNVANNNNVPSYGYNTSNGVYTLFNDDGYVIAAVVVGEDNGTTTNYAYAYGDYTAGGAMVKESYSKDSKQWTWEAQAIVNGEDVILTEIGDSLNSSGLKTMTPNNWYEVKYKADGTVKSVTEIAAGSKNGIVLDTDNPVPGGEHGNKTNVFCVNPVHFDGRPVTVQNAVDGKNDYPKYVGKIEMVKNANIDNDGKLVLFEDLSTNGAKSVGDVIYAINAKANTLQVTNKTLASGNDKGFSVSASAKIWLIQDDYLNVTVKTKWMNTVIDCGEGSSGLKKAITSLNLYDARNDKADVPFNGYISAVFENGMATTVIIYEQNANLIDQGSTDIGPNGRIMDNKSTVEEVNEALQDGDVYIKDSWSPRRVAGEVRRVDIPRGRTLTIERNFNAVYEDVAVHLEDGNGVGTLKVGGTYTMAYDTTDTVNYDIVADSMRIVRAGGALSAYDPATVQPYGVTIDSTVVVENGLVIQDATEESPMEYELKVARGGSLTVKTGGVHTMKYDDANAVAGTDTVNVWVDGHMSVNGGTVTPNILVTYNNSLHVKGIMTGKLILDGGKAEIGNLQGEVRMLDDTDELIITGALSGDIAEVTRGATITLEENSRVTGAAATTLGIAGTVTSGAVLVAQETVTEVDAETFAPKGTDEPVVDDTEGTIDVAEGGEAVTLVKDGNAVTVTADLSAVAAAVNEDIESFDPEAEHQTIGGFGISPNSAASGNKYLVCTRITWKPAVRDAAVTKCEVLRDGTVIASSDSEADAYDPDTKITGSSFYAHLGIIKNTGTEESPVWAYDGSDVSRDATYTIKWYYDNDEVVTQTRSVSFTLTSAAN